jgi:stress response protein SCP2
MLNEVASNETAFILGRLINTNDGWEFEPYPIGYQGGLAALVDIYS